MRPVREAVAVLQDQLVRRYKWPGGSWTSVGKRVGKDCPTSADARRVYTKDGPAGAVKQIMKERNCGLAEAYDLLKKARGVERPRWKCVVK